MRMKSNTYKSNQCRRCWSDTNEVGQWFAANLSESLKPIWCKRLSTKCTKPIWIRLLRYYSAAVRPLIFFNFPTIRLSCWIKHWSSTLSNEPIKTFKHPTNWLSLTLCLSELVSVINASNVLLPNSFFSGFYRNILPIQREKWKKYISLY